MSESPPWTRRPAIGKPALRLGGHALWGCAPAGIVTNAERVVQVWRLNERRAPLRGECKKWVSWDSGERLRSYV
jgi:hypothetical protein